ncbi:phage-related membrane protein [Escherichia coli]|nr:phage-related membrane protein [Escherichia coli]
MDTSGFDIQFDNHIPENGYRIEGYLCNANNAKECQAIMVRSEPFIKLIILQWEITGH